MKRYLVCLLSLVAVPACQGVSNIQLDVETPDLARTDPNTDLAVPSCPAVPGSTKSYCYWAKSSPALGNALELPANSLNCSLESQGGLTLAANAQTTVCAIKFKPEIANSWMLDVNKPVYLTFSYSSPLPWDFRDQAKLTVSDVMSGNVRAEFTGIADSQNTIKLSYPMGIFTRNLVFTLQSSGGSLAKAKVTFDWILISQ